MSTIPSQGMSAVKGLNAHPTGAIGKFSAAQSNAILIVGFASAIVSLVSALVTLRWFLLMRRSYRHHLIIFLILSDTWKSLWFFIYPVVYMAKHHHVESTSGFCQASGFFLAIGFEASDFAILAIALHAILYVFQRPQVKGEGGLYPYRKVVYAAWIGIPILFASLAFTNPQTAYVTSGTFCYLPKRPIWYRLALSYIPRYLIFFTIFGMYAVIYLYVHIKFKGFDNFGVDPGSGSASHQFSTRDQSRNPSSATDPLDLRDRTLIEEEDRRKVSANEQPDTSERPPWENVQFITSKQLYHSGVAKEDFAPDMGSSSTDTQVPSRHLSIQSMNGKSPFESRKQSEVPTLGTNSTSETAGTRSSFMNNTPASKQQARVDPLQSTRNSIRRQLRYLFIYPAVYLLMWTFPFANNCLVYSDYYAMHPPFWLAVVATFSLSMQAGVDCAIFSIRERPWRRIDESSPGSWSWMTNIMRGSSRKPQPDMSGKATATADEQRKPKRGPDWWIAEGLKRKDSVWLGTDTLNQIISRQTAEEAEGEA